MSAVQEEQRADYSCRGSRMHARKEKKKNISHIISIQQFNQKVLSPAMNMTTSGLPKGWKPLLNQHTYEHTYKTYVPRGSCQRSFSKREMVESLSVSVEFGKTEVNTINRRAPTSNTDHKILLREKRIICKKKIMSQDENMGTQFNKLKTKYLGKKDFAKKFQ